MENKKQIKIKEFKNEDQEREFWGKFELPKHVEKKDFVSASFPNLKPSSHSISIRVPDYLLIRLKEQGNKLNIPYQTLMKQYIAKGVLQK